MNKMQNPEGSTSWPPAPQVSEPVKPKEPTRYLAGRLSLMASCIAIFTLIGGLLFWGKHAWYTGTLSLSLSPPKDKALFWFVMILAMSFVGAISGVLGRRTRSGKMGLLIAATILAAIAYVAIGELLHGNVFNYNI